MDKKDIKYYTRAKLTYEVELPLPMPMSPETAMLFLRAMESALRESQEYPITIIEQELLNPIT